MESLSVTTYKGFSKVFGEISLTEFITIIRSDRYKKKIEEVASLVNEGLIDKANEVKKQLPIFTATANYAGNRLPEGIMRYNDVPTIDIDDLTDEQVVSLKPIIEADPYVLVNFLTPKRHGYKVLLYLLTPYAEQLRKAAFGATEITYEALEHYHRQMYELCREYCENLTKMKVDVSGKDIGRAIFGSYDPQAYLNPELLQRVVVPAIKIVPPLPKDKKRGRKPKAKMEGDPSVNIASLEPWQKMEYQKAVNSTRRIMRFEEGNRDTFLFTLGNKCYNRGISEEVVLLLVEHDYSKPDLDFKTPISNAYRYTDKVDATTSEKKEEKKPMVEMAMEFLDTHYSVRRNVILERLEFADYAESAPGKEPAFHLMRPKDYNSIYLSMQLARIHCYQTVLHAIIDSNYAQDYNPFEDYFNRLPAWDGTTDYIEQLADTLVTDDQKFWHNSFKHWLVGFVAGALRDEVANHLVLILFSKQGRGKSSWIRNLLPPQLKKYYRNGMINPENKDHSLLMSSHLLINMEEFEGMRYGDVAGLKRMVTQEVITERKAYDPNIETYIRHASFIGSTNELRFLQDFSGARRFICPVVSKIDYRTPVNYEGVYGQAFSLLNSGYRYWYEGEEIEQLNKRNEMHRVKDPVEEMLYIFYRQAMSSDLGVKWKPAAAILSTIAVYGRIQINKLAQQNLIKVLERDGFNKRESEHGVTEYEVMQFCLDDVENNYKKVIKMDPPVDVELPF